VPAVRPALLESFARLVGAYRRGIDWEGADQLECRATLLLAGLLLARIDGKSPVEYIRDDATKNHVRGIARRALRSPPATLAAWLDFPAAPTPEAAARSEGTDQPTVFARASADSGGIADDGDG
jgi:hypothetical protein